MICKSRLYLVFLPAANLSTAFLSLDPAPHAYFLVPDELPDDAYPATMVGQILVELFRNLVDLPEPGPRNGGEIVVLVMQTDVVCEEVEGSVVRESLGYQDTLLGVTSLFAFERGAIEDIVLGDEVTSNRVERSGKETAQDEVSHSLASPRLDQHVIKQKLNNNVQGVNPGEGNLVDHHGPQCVEQDLEGTEESLAGNRVEEEGLERCG